MSLPGSKYYGKNFNKLNDNPDTKTKSSLFYDLLNEDAATEEDLENKVITSTRDPIIKEDNTCLISNKELTDNFVTLACNHRFNYMSLYNEVHYQKTQRVLDNAMLRLNEIKCPYCRTVTPKLLPYFKYYDVRQVRGVNHPQIYSMKLHSCQYLNKHKLPCNMSACKTKHGILCNRHNKARESEDIFLSTVDNSEFVKYNKKKLPDLKTILKTNGCKVSGTKQQLVERIIVEKHKKLEWLE